MRRWFFCITGALFLLTVLTTCMQPTADAGGGAAPLWGFAVNNPANAGEATGEMTGTDETIYTGEAISEMTGTDEAISETANAGEAVSANEVVNIPGATSPHPQGISPIPTPTPTPSPPWPKRPNYNPQPNNIPQLNNIPELNNIPQLIEDTEGSETRRPMIALTFDDGPSRFTVPILDILAAYGGRATFCVIGNRLDYREATAHRIVDEGHEMLGHSWSHRDMTTQTRAEITATIRNTDDAVYAITGVRIPLFRPPYGAVNTLVTEVAAELGQGILLWSVDPRDWANRCADYIYEYIITYAHDGAIVVLHDIFATTAEAMERVIPRLVADGFELVTASEMLAYFYGDIVPGQLYRGKPAW